MDKKFTAKVEIKLTGEMVSNLALMGGYFSHQQAIENAAEDIGTILREKMIGLPVKGGEASCRTRKQRVQNRVDRVPTRSFGGVCGSRTC